MILTGSLLAGLAVCLAWPVPVKLAQKTSASSDPVASLLLWQAVGLAGGLSLIGTAIAFALVPLRTDVPRGLSALAFDAQVRGSLSWWQWLLLVVAVVLIARLAGCLGLALLNARRDRNRHRARLEVLSVPSQELPNTRVVDTQQPVAYCLPAGRQATTVISTGLLSALNEPARNAVIAHERAHISQRHDLLLVPFAAWRRALPFLAAPSLALASITRHIEFAADDAARRQVSAHVLAEAIATSARLAHAHSRTLTEARISRLAHPLPEVRVRQRVLACIIGLSLLGAPTVLILAPLLSELAA